MPKDTPRPDQGATPTEIESELDSTLTTPEPPPVPTDGTPVWELVIADMRARDSFGREKYGTPLQAGNGRDPLVDAYQEALDLAVYLRQAIAEREVPGVHGEPRGHDHRRPRTQGQPLAHFAESTHTARILDGVEVIARTVCGRDRKRSELVPHGEATCPECYPRTVIMGSTKIEVGS